MELESSSWFLDDNCYVWPAPASEQPEYLWNVLKISTCVGKRDFLCHKIEQEKLYTMLYHVIKG